MKETVKENQQWLELFHDTEKYLIRTTIDIMGSDQEAETGVDSSTDDFDEFREMLP